MTSKYAKYVKPLRHGELYIKEHEGKMAVPVRRFDKGCLSDITHWFEFFWVYAPGEGIGTPIKNHEREQLHKPWAHAHKPDEYFIFMGTDPHNPDDLGGEVEFWLGEGKDAEKFNVTKSSGIFVPGGLAHNPWVVRSVDKPFIVLVVVPSADYEFGDFAEVSPDFKQ